MEACETQSTVVYSLLSVFSIVVFFQKNRTTYKATVVLMNKVINILLNNKLYVFFQQQFRVIEVLKEYCVIFFNFHRSFKFQIHHLNLIRRGDRRAGNKLGRDIRHFDVMVQQRCEIDILDGEERMVLDVIDAVLQRADAKGCVGVQQAANERLAVGVEVRWEAEMFLGVHDLLEGALLVAGLERGVAAEQFVHQHPKGPVVDALVVALRQHKFSANN